LWTFTETDKVSGRSYNRRGVADGEHVGPPRHAQIGIYLDATHSVGFGADPTSGGRSDDARGPQYRTASNMLAVDDNSIGIDMFNSCIRSNVYADALQVLMCSRRELLGI